MLAVIVADSCHAVEGTILWYLWGCFLAPYTALAFAGLAALTCSSLLRRRMPVKA